MALSPFLTPDQILAAVKQLRDLMSWGVFPDGRTGLSSLLDPLLDSSSLDPLWSLHYWTLYWSLLCSTLYWSLLH